MKYKLIGEPQMDILTTVLYNRSIENLSEFLNPDVERTNPFNFKMMKKGIEILSECIDNELKIGILVDTDCDGYTSAALIYNFIKDILNYQNIKVLFHDKDKAHGLVPDVMNQILSSELGLIICPDSSSSDIEQQKEIVSHGTSILILDHHIFEEEFVHDKVALINNQEGPHVNNTFSGVGVTYEFVCAYCSYYSIELPKYKYLDLVAIGNIADVMDLRNLENRMICKRGLDNIENKYFKELFSRRDIEIPTIVDVAFNIAPEINAVIRMGSKEDKLKLFHVLTGRDYFVTYKLRGGEETMVHISKEVVKISSSLRNKQRTSVKKIIEKLKPQVDSFQDKNILIIKIESDTPYALTGLIATQLAKQNKKNCIVLRESSETPNTYTGSARTYSDMNFKDLCSETNLFNFCAGHQGSFGVSLDMDKLDIIIDTLDNLLQGTTGEVVYEVDYVIQGRDLRFGDVKAIADLKHLWGNGIEEPIFAITNINIPHSTIKQLTRSTVGFNYNKINFIKTFAPSGFLEDISCKQFVKFKPINIQLNIVCKFVDTKYGPQVQIVDFESKPYEEVLW